MYRNIVLMMHYNTDTQEIARPSEVLLRIQSYVSTLRSLELYGTNIIKNTLLVCMHKNTLHVHVLGMSNY